MTKQPQTLWDFEGDWRLSRTIHDKLAKKTGVLEGQATFQRTEDGLSYHETGALTYGDAPPLAASRRYVWKTAPVGIAVFFEDGTPFHSFTLRRTMPEATHLCDPDLYNVSYDFTPWPRWSSTWRVVGPRKDYRMISEFHRN